MSKRLFTIALPLALISAWMWPRLPRQDRSSYFDFADSSSLLGLPNWQNVLSNLPFIFIGLWALGRIRLRPRAAGLDFSASLFALALFLTGFGSSYFHWNPNPATLFWDRLPMAVAFGSLCCLLTIDRIYPQLSRAQALLVVTLCSATVVNWSFGSGDLRPYLLVQYVGALYVLQVTLVTPNNTLKRAVVVASLAFYVLAKALEVYDRSIFEALHWTSGHALKHLFAALSAALIFEPWKSHRPDETA